MKYCTKCGNELCDDAVICPKCGCLADASKKPKTTAPEQSVGDALETRDLRSQFLCWLPLVLGVIAILSASIKCICMFAVLDDAIEWYKLYINLYNWRFVTLFCLPTTGLLAIFFAIPDLLRKQNKLPAILGLSTGVASLLIPIITAIYNMA